MKKHCMVTCVIAIWLLFIFAGSLQAAEKYPVKPIELIVAVEAGADGDVITRPIAQKLSEKLGQPVIVVNKPGAGSSIGYREVYNAKPDGYTIGWYSATIITNKLQGILPYDYRDFVHLGTLCTYFPIVVGSTKSKYQFKTIQEAIEFAKANPGAVTMATAGVGQSWWIAAMAFITATGINVNVIPQAGTGAVTVAQVAGGHADLGVVAVGSAKPLIDSGQVRFLATLGEGRAPAPYDKYPTLKELGYPAVWESTNGLFAPPKFPKKYADILIPLIKEAQQDPAYRKFVEARNARWEYIPPEQLVARFDKRREVVREIMAKAGILKEK